ncbi:unnamed protein product [Paramecium sonneborni]|uniref:Uncharacterized protein n=1 Tax=Paramecium sonneborni TaxID=65129 RepID=A0A8S1NSF2_9CILI|nr:unnamed protein product [Paramecium sonneborni]
MEMPRSKLSVYKIISINLKFKSALVYITKVAHQINCINNKQQQSVVIKLFELTQKKLISGQIKQFKDANLCFDFTLSI